MKLSVEAVSLTVAIFWGGSIDPPGPRDLRPWPEVYVK